ncbi:MAG: hypothetical protein A2W90_19615 [Bacteroidetes bacterium GWF2_42_66]|nr:MAG: hypothetical protein A2W92_17865 [Bacteroidetes bacterium GWA2_42_15]OFX98631.1 MAG: hypothetical protein A2W89_10080 [Bacteroidetes bacterium GWE2_42_39]OFY43172.1 MAG: hypothetical protein A2W90_19615 [Bacteroidetes bacterium GWF2_42_66]HBL76975.1 hypothetical protein [Prolixibacteraceae bacterium]HCR89623.1 hypothetical protein [Prolixibacteraceae bacterium]
MGQDAPFRILDKLLPTKGKIETSKKLKETNKAVVTDDRKGTPSRYSNRDRQFSLHSNEEKLKSSFNLGRFQKPVSVIQLIRCVLVYTL